MAATTESIAAIAAATAAGLLVRLRPRKTEVGCPSGVAACALLAGAAWLGSSADRL